MKTYLQYQAWVATKTNGSATIEGGHEAYKQAHAEFKALGFTIGLIDPETSGIELVVDDLLQLRQRAQGPEALVETIVWKFLHARWPNAMGLALWNYTHVYSGFRTSFTFEIRRLGYTCIVDDHRKTVFVLLNTEEARLRLMKRLGITTVAKLKRVETKLLKEGASKEEVALLVAEFLKKVNEAA